MMTEPIKSGCEPILRQLVEAIEKDRNAGIERLTDRQIQDQVETLMDDYFNVFLPFDQKNIERPDFFTKLDREVILRILSHLNEKPLKVTPQQRATLLRILLSLVLSKFYHGQEIKPNEEIKSALASACPLITQQGKQAEAERKTLLSLLQIQKQEREAINQRQQVIHKWTSSEWAQQYNRNLKNKPPPTPKINEDIRLNYKAVETYKKYLCNKASDYFIISYIIDHTREVQWRSFITQLEITLKSLGPELSTFCPQNTPIAIRPSLFQDTPNILPPSVTRYAPHEILYSDPELTDTSASTWVARLAIRLNPQLKQRLWFDVFSPANVLYDQGIQCFIFFSDVAFTGYDLRQQMLKTADELISGKNWLPGTSKAHFFVVCPYMSAKAFKILSEPIVLDIRTTIAVSLKIESLEEIITQDKIISGAERKALLEAAKKFQLSDKFPIYWAHLIDRMHSMPVIYNGWIPNAQEQLPENDEFCRSRQKTIRKFNLINACQHRSTDLIPTSEIPYFGWTGYSPYNIAQDCIPLPYKPPRETCTSGY